MVLVWTVAPLYFKSVMHRFRAIALLGLTVVLILTLMIGTGIEEKPNVWNLKVKEQRLMRVIDLDNPQNQFYPLKLSDEYAMLVVSAFCTKKNQIIVNAMCPFRSTAPDTIRTNSMSMNCAIRVLPEHHLHPWTACQIYCTALEEEKEAENLNDFVIISQDSMGVVVENKILLNRVEESERLDGIRVCVSPVIGDVYRRRIIEWIEYHKMIGVRDFVFYDYQMGKEMEKVLQMYQMEQPNMIQILPWKYPNCYALKSTLENMNISYSFECVDLCHYYGQMIAIQDCFARSRGSHEWVVFFDLDEYLIIDSHFKTLNSILNSNGSTCGAIFRNQFCGSNCAGNFDGIQSIDQILMNSGISEISEVPGLRNWVCEPALKKHKRAKSIVNPACFDVIGIHVPYSFKGTKCVQDMSRMRYLNPEKDGYLKHVRSIAKQPCFAGNVSSIRFSLNMTAELVDLVSQKFSKLDQNQRFKIT
jgi:hypothetical protein